MSALTRNQSLVLDALQSASRLRCKSIGRLKNWLNPDSYTDLKASTPLLRASTMAAVVTGQRPS